MLTIVCGSIPAAKPLYDRYISKKPAFAGSYGSSDATGSHRDAKKSYNARQYGSRSGNYPSRSEYVEQKDINKRNIRMNTIFTYERGPGKLSGDGGGRAEVRVWSDTTPVIGPEMRALG